MKSQSVRSLGLYYAVGLLLTLPCSAFAIDKEDIDSNGSVNATDVQLVINAALGFSQQYGSRADVNGSGGAVDAVDVQLVINCALGLSGACHPEPLPTTGTSCERVTGVGYTKVNTSDQIRIYYSPGDRFDASKVVAVTFSDIPSYAPPGLACNQYKKTGSSDPITVSGVTMSVAMHSWPGATCTTGYCYSVTTNPDMFPENDHELQGGQYIRRAHLFLKINGTTCGCKEIKK